MIFSWLFVLLHNINNTPNFNMGLPQMQMSTIYFIMLIRAMALIWDKHKFYTM